METAPRRTSVRTAAMVVTGRRSAAELSDMCGPRSGLVAGLLGDQLDRGLVRKRQMIGGEHHVTRLERDDTRGAIGEDLRLAAVGATHLHVHPFGLAVD